MSVSPALSLHLYVLLSNHRRQIHQPTHTLFSLDSSRSLFFIQLEDFLYSQNEQGHHTDFLKNKKSVFLDDGGESP